VNARRGVRVTDMAKALHLHRRTLNARSYNAHYPSPSAIIAWARLLLVADISMNVALSTDRAAMLAGFSSGTAFRNMLRRYTGLRPTEVRERGGVDCILAVLRHTIGAIPSDHDGPPER
jgi:transcriptional regulator GlxA family with amidase domain